MIEPVKALCELLSSAPLTAEEVADSLGAWKGGEDNTPMIVKPQDASIKEARVVGKDDGSEEPAYVDLTPAKPLTIRDLKAAFGAYRNVPRATQIGQPARVAFEYDQREMPCTVTIFASYEPGSNGAEDGRVVRLTLRRDAR